MQGERMKQLTIIAVVAVLTLSMIAGCTPNENGRPGRGPAGFFTGVWHGWIAPISLVWGFFNRSVRIYDKHNTGWWYDFGYYIAVISGFGGLSLSRKRKKDGD